MIGRDICGGLCFNDVGMRLGKEEKKGRQSRRQALNVIAQGGGEVGGMQEWHKCVCVGHSVLESHGTER